MIAFARKRIFGLIGAPRSGKDEIAKYLIETRGFEALAFADQVKEEFGISKEDFEAAKIAGNIEELREKLWNFSAKIREKEPLHFIKNVIDKANKTSKSVVITDIRTKDEFDEVFFASAARIYWVIRGDVKFDNGLLPGSKLTESTIKGYLNEDAWSHPIRTINNTAEGIYYLYQDLDKFFFLEDVKDLLHTSTEEGIVQYLEQYDVRQMRKV
jgi:hypothetical protein